MDKREIKAIRERHHWTQRELAELLGYSVGHVAHLEQDNKGSRKVNKRLERQLMLLDKLYPEKKVNLSS